MTVPKYLVGPGIVDLSGMIERDAGYATRYVNLFLNSTKQQPRGVLFAIDPARSPSAIIEDLRPYLDQLHRPYKGKKDLQSLFLDGTITVATAGRGVDFETYSLPNIKGYRGIKTWLDYLRCYDLRYNVPQGQTPPSFGRIATQVYGRSTSKTYERAEQGCKRVRRLIEAAENNHWPPSIR